jgi:membrane-associated phospholipid phosphatase
VSTLAPTHQTGPALSRPIQPRGDFSRTDRLALGFIAGALLATLALHPSPLVPASLLLLQGLGVVVVARWSARTTRARWVHAFFPILIVIGLFETLGPIIAAANPARLDLILARLDARIFGSLVGAWRDALGRPSWLTDLASIAYVSFYPFPLFVAIALYRRPNRADFELFSTAIVGTFLASYVGYFFWPAAGPRVPPELASEVLGGGAVSAFVRAFLQLVERNQLDAFPSGHAAVALTTLLLAWPRFPRARFAMLLIVGGILFSTVYLSLHYAVDLVAGIALALVVVAASRRRVT